jgi:hypothetical protein
MKKDRKLFKGADDWHLNAVLDYDHKPWFLYADGFKEAADRLVISMIDNRSSLDYLVYPIVFLYRHHLELRLKEIIINGNMLLDQPHNIPKTHPLDALWQKARLILLKVWSNGSEKDLMQVDTVIREFSDVDPSSEAFRYPIDKKTENYLIPRDLTHINVRHLQKEMKDPCELLDSANDGIREYLENKWEAEGEMQERYQ